MIKKKIHTALIGLGSIIGFVISNKRPQTNNEDQDQTPHTATSRHGPHCMLDKNTNLCCNNKDDI